MSKRLLLTVLSSTVLSLFAPRVVPAADQYKIDPQHMSIVFSVAHTGLSYTYGFFREAAGFYIIDTANPANCRFRLIIQATSLDTNNAKRDQHLRSPDFFNVDQFKEITFDSTKCEAANTPEGGIIYKLTGDLTMHGVKRPIVIPLRMLGAGKGAYNDDRTGFLCQIELKRSDFGMSNLLEKNLVGDAVGITVSFEGFAVDAQGNPLVPTN